MQAWMANALVFGPAAQGFHVNLLWCSSAEGVFWHPHHPLPTPCLDNMCSEAVIKIESTVSVSSIDDRVCSPSHCRWRSTLKCRIGLCAFIFFVAIYWSASCLYCPPEIGRILGYMHTAYFHSFAFATLQYYFSPPQCMVCLFTTCAREPRLSYTSFSRTFFFCL